MIGILMRVVLVVQSLIIAGLIFYTLSLQQQLERLQAVTTLPQTTQAEPQPVQVKSRRLLWPRISRPPAAITELRLCSQICRQQRR